MCGKNLSTDTVSTIGIQRRYNYALQPMSREEFVGIVMADQPDAPPYFTFDAALNTKERSTLEATLARVMIPLTVEDLLRLRNAGAQILDTRDPAQFADPERFDIARTPNRHLAFATGAHQCAGMALARLEGAIAISRFLARFPNYAVSGQPVRGGRVRFRGFLSVPCTIG